MCSLDDTVPFLFLFFLKKENMVPLLIRFQHIGPFISVAFGPCWVALAAVFPLGPVLGFFFLPSGPGLILMVAWYW